MTTQHLRAKLTWKRATDDVRHLWPRDTPMPIHAMSSQRSLHNAPIFRLLLKVAVNGTHQCDYSNFCGNLGSQLSRLISKVQRSLFESRLRFFATHAPRRARVSQGRANQ